MVVILCDDGNPDLTLVHVVGNKVVVCVMEVYVLFRIVISRVGEGFPALRLVARQFLLRADMEVPVLFRQYLAVPVVLRQGAFLFHLLGEAFYAARILVRVLADILYAVPHHIPDLLVRQLALYRYVRVRRIVIHEDNLVTLGIIVLYLPDIDA